MAKAIKFPLEMDGEQVRDIDSLKEHFNIEKVVEYFLSGKLLTWLEARYYDDEAEAVSQLSSDDPDVAGKLCDIFGIEHAGESTIDVEAVAERNARLARLREYTDDEDILADVDLVAFNQEELADLYDQGAEKIILCGGDFRVPKSKYDVGYILVGGATINGVVPQQESTKETQPELEDSPTGIVGSAVGGLAAAAALNAAALNAAAAIAKGSIKPMSAEAGEDKGEERHTMFANTFARFMHVYEKEEEKTSTDEIKEKEPTIKILGISKLGSAFDLDTEQ